MVTETNKTKAGKESKRRGGMTALQRRRLRVPRTGLHEQAATRLRILIVRGDLAPGEQLLESGMSEALGISRTPLREALKQLAAEGLFSPERKRALPFLPAVIGLVCGRESAAERDVVQNAQRRWPAVRFRIEQSAVQGPYAAGEVIEALRKLDADPEVEVIVIARGGGSLEDLLPFSDEDLLRAVAACRTPVVSAIGHEQDTPLLDYVADLRASTPTDAAKRVVPDVTEQLALVTQLRDRARRSVRGWIEREQAWLDGVRSRPALADPVREIERQAEQVDALTRRARQSLDASLTRAADDITHTKARLLALSPSATLRRGYAIVQDPDGAVVRAAADVSAGARLTVRFAEDQLTVTAVISRGDDPP